MGIIDKNDDKEVLMMKKNKLFFHILSLVAALTLLMSLSAIQVAAAPDGGEQDIAAAEQGEQPAADEPIQDTPIQDEPVADEPAITPDDGDDTDPDAGDAGDSDDVQQDPGTVDDGMYEYITGYVDDAVSDYQAPEALDDLPQVQPTEVIFATTMVLPDVAVSDASLTSGIIMWLCVAVGIAVVVGVMVSKRTRRRMS